MASGCFLQDSLNRYFRPRTVIANTDDDHHDRDHRESNEWNQCFSHIGIMPVKIGAINGDISEISPLIAPFLPE